MQPQIICSIASCICSCIVIIFNWVNGFVYLSITDIAWCFSFSSCSIFVVNLCEYFCAVAHIIATAAMLPWSSVHLVVHVLVAGDAAALVAALVAALLLDPVLLDGVVALVVVFAAASLRCLHFRWLVSHDWMLCVSGAVFCSILENACAICCVACSIICDMDRICCWVGNVACILLFGAGWWWERFGDGRMLLDGLFCQFYQLLHFLFHLVLVGGGNVLAMVGCSWMACSVNSTSCYISSVP